MQLIKVRCTLYKTYYVYPIVNLYGQPLNYSAKVLWAVLIPKKPGKKIPKLIKVSAILGQAVKKHHSYGLVNF